MEDQTVIQRSGSAAGVRKTQAERRAESRQAVLDSAVRLFGEQGYAATALEQIAADCGLTIRPIYHYFGNKKALFAAVNEVMEQRIIASMVDTAADSGEAIQASWRAYLELCEDPGFRQVVLLDGPTVLGRERWASSPVTRKARRSLGGDERDTAPVRQRRELFGRMLMGAFAEAALAVAEAEDVDLARRQAEQLVSDMFGQLPMFDSE